MKKWLFAVLAILNFFGAFLTFSSFALSLRLAFQSTFGFIFFITNLSFFLLFVINGIYFSKIGFRNLKQNILLKLGGIFSLTGFILFLLSILAIFTIGINNDYIGLIIVTGFFYGGAIVLGVFNLVAFIFISINYFKSRKPQKNRSKKR